jgi:hypothetical protein
LVGAEDTNIHRTAKGPAVTAVETVTAAVVEVQMVAVDIDSVKDTL